MSRCLSAVWRMRLDYWRNFIYIMNVMLDLQLLEKYFDESSGSDADSIASALKPFGLTDESHIRAVCELEGKCRRSKVSVSKSINRVGDTEIAFCVSFSVFDGFAIRFQVQASIFDDYIEDEFTVTLNGVSKYRGTKFMAAVNETDALVEEGIGKREGYMDSSDYKCSLFKIKYLYSFKKLLEDKSIDKSKVERFLKGVKCSNVFVTDSFVRSLYSFDGGDFSVDMFDDGRIELKSRIGEKEFAFAGNDMCVCFRHLFEVIC